MSSSNWLAESIPSFRNLQKAVASGSTFPVVAIGGTEEYAISEARELLVRHLMKDAAEDFDFFEADASSLTAADLNEQLMTMPMFSPRRVVVLNDADEFGKDEAKANLLKRYQAKPSPTTSLILVQALERKPNKFEMDRLTKTPDSYWFFELKVSELSKFVTSFAALHKKKIEPRAVEYLVENSTSQLRDLKAKLEHLILYAGDAAEITAEMAMRATGITAEVDLFKFEDAILAGDASRVLREARELLDKGLEELALLGRLRALMSKVWQSGGLAARQAPDDDFRKVLGGQAFKKPEFINAARRLGNVAIQDALLSLLQIELHAKSKSSEVRSFIFEWLWTVCGGKKSGNGGTLFKQREYVR